MHALLPHTQVVFTGEVGKDPRNYRVDFTLLNQILPDFKCSYTLDKGIEELFLKYKEKSFALADFDGDQFVRLRTLKNRMGLITYAIP